MQIPSKIAHPLKNRTGTSQRTRLIDALRPEAAPIDGKTLADRLYLICEYAGYINFHTYVDDTVEGEYQQLDTWTSFFANSLPFQLAKLSKASVEDLEEQFLGLYNELKANPTKQSLESMLGFVYDKLIVPTDVLYKTVAEAKNNFTVPLLAIVKSSFIEPIKCYIALYNASATFLCVDKKKFSEYLAHPWQLKVDEVYALDLCIKRVKKGKKEAYLIAADTLNGIFYQMLNGFQDIVDEAPLFIEESLRPLEVELRQKHRPHLALLFTFLELLKYFQGNINDLGIKHLDFFYEQVLKMVPKEAVPDKAHIVFEVAKHLEAYPLPKDLLLKDGKDGNKQDIQFGLDHEIVLDKGQVQDLRTLALNKVGGDKKYIEGVYMAPVSNSIDGQGKKFKADQANNWPTLGSKYNKYVQEGNLVGDEHPRARIGFVLSSPVLLLREGKRSISFYLDCTISNSDNSLSNAQIVQLLNDITSKLVLPDTKITYCINDQILEECELSLSAKNYISKLLVNQNPYEIDANALEVFFDTKDTINCCPIFEERDIGNLKDCLEATEVTKKDNDNSLFKVWFSGEKEWIPATPIVHIHLLHIAGLPQPDGIQFELFVELGPDVPAITFYDDETLEEKFDLQNNFPLVKIELNEEVQINCGNKSGKDEDCCLRKPTVDHELWVSPYHFLQKLKLTAATIDVKVCGVKNLIVQNDDNLQDVNKPIYPFGPRPKVGENWIVDKGANFYIGSKEIFCKNWKKFWINTTWKDKPENLHDHYIFYRGDDFENGNSAITDCSFRFVTSVLNDGLWAKDVHNVVQPPPPNLDDAGSSENNWDDQYSSEYEAGQYLALFKNSVEDVVVEEEPNPCVDPAAETEADKYMHKLKDDYFDGYDYKPKSMSTENLEPLTVNTRKGFIRLTLAGTSFQHDRFTYVLARQMMALAGLLDPESIELVKNDLELLKKLSDKAIELMTDILREINFVVTHVNTLNNSLLPDLLTTAQSLQGHLDFVKANYDDGTMNPKDRLDDALEDIQTIIDEIDPLAADPSILNELDHAKGDLVQIKAFIEDNPPADENGISDDNINDHLDDFGLQIILIDMKRRILRVSNTLDVENVGGIPKEPYTPLIKSLSIDYEATATLNDMEIVHLYPFENTSKGEDIEQNPTLFPYSDDEGTLFIGIEALTPGGTLSLLFQLAEATPDSEQDRAEIHWHYLTNNNWVDLLPDFDVISDGTDGLTVSGIVTIAVPDAISKIGNTVMPDNLYWLKVSAPENVRAVAETIGVHTQAAKASARLNELNDTGRLETALEAGSIGKLQKGDFSIKKVEQPYASFGGRKPEAEGHFYTRVSEHLKHKGRGLMINDFEKVVLEGFPEIYKVKCSSHTMGLSANEYRRDLEVAPGFVVVAVIPDLTKLKAGNQLQPKAPVSLLEKIGDHLRKKISPFARLKIMNPRYEPVDVCVSVRLYRGKSERFYAKKLQEDLTFFLAPWFLGDTEKLAFGEEVLFSDVVGFIEQLDYVDFIVDLKLEGRCEQTGTLIQPLTARSILTAGTICIKIDKEKCPEPIGNDVTTELT